MKDHVYMLVSIPPKISISGFMEYLKEKSTLMTSEKHANLKYKYGNRYFWSEGYYEQYVLGKQNYCDVGLSHMQMRVDFNVFNDAAEFIGNLKFYAYVAALIHFDNINQLNQYFALQFVVILVFSECG